MELKYPQAYFLYTAALKLADALTVAAVWQWCWYLRFRSEWIPVTKGLPDYDKYATAMWPLMLVYVAVFHAIGTYRRDRVHFGFRAVKKIVQGSFMGTLVFVSVLYLQREFDYSRAYLLLFPALAVLGLIFERFLLDVLWKAVERLFVKRIRILLVGTGELLKLYLAKIQDRRPYPIEWVGHVEDDATLMTRMGAGDVDMVVVSYPNAEAHRYESTLRSLANELVAVKVLPDFGKYSTFTYAAEHECGIPLLAFNQTPAGTSDRVLKRVGDIIGALSFLILFSPLYLLIALLIKLTSRGPIFYSQHRMGVDGTAFMLYKFRSMRVDAEKATGAVWAKEGDPRVTTVGKWLRRTSLDELPQFYNVLKGNMSLVGPRPERPVFVEQFRREIPKYMLRHKMKSGITGWAQVNGWRGNTSIEERIKFDLFYIGHWSHYLDLKILCMTLWKGFIHRHAY